MLEDNEFQQRIQKIEGLVRKIETLTDSDARASALELFQAIMDLHVAGLERVMNMTFDAGDEGRKIINAFAADDLVARLLLLYGLHPLDLEARVMAALDKLQPQLRSQGGSAELIGVVDGVVRLRIESSGQGCASTAQKLKLAVEGAIYDAAPDAAAVQIESDIGAPPPSRLVQLEIAPGKKSSAKPAGKNSEDFASL